ncbi:MAG: glycosyltransferase family 4 protein [Candidatus Eisenbacteria bacterium]|uniref:Glycosyltransferase family 4 protein n=1 Tax=Eiseniibacteriota bacterium TaxID=2212470 RepID=A0A948W5P4_UNCEI|nr:glycosyltransferase family 4 protein [Candidatus Eisenbacteria bacterium]MBU1950546.1 glycosyltransferase family 4 protein [Candidatus Eisenbacteria bacterium]MBU2690639.1 glycosyltransferase family 4 protein [Candidatus Eisenbacteria bacterium]
MSPPDDRKHGADSVLGGRRPLKIAMVGQKGIPATYGGIERHVEEIGMRLVERGHEVTVFSRNHYSSHTGMYRGIRTIRFPSLNTKHFDAISHCAIATLITMFSKYDIVHFHALGPSIFAWLPRLKKTKTIVTVHGLDWQRGKWGKMARLFLQKCEEPAVKFPNRTIVVSKTLRKYFKEEYNAETFFIPNGTNPGAQLPPNKIKRYNLDKHPYILFVGRLVPEKGCHYLIEAFRRLDTDVRLVMAGGSSFSDGYVDSLESLRDNDPRVQMVGYVYGEVLDELWTNAYFVALPSILEGQSISLIEALSYGKCVLLSDIPENVEVVENEAVTFRSRDVEDLHKKMKMLLENPEMVSRVAKQCGHLAEDQFSWSRIVEATESVYYDAVSGSPPKPKRKKDEESHSSEKEDELQIIEGGKEEDGSDRPQHRSHF